MKSRAFAIIAGLVLSLSSATSLPAQMERVQFNHPGLTVDLGVGLWAWPLPMDWDEDGDLDLIVSCPDVPFNGIYFFENPGGDEKLPTFKPPVRLGDAIRNVRVSYIDQHPVVMAPGFEYENFLGEKFDQRTRLSASSPQKDYNKTRANQWHSIDYEGDGDQDLIVGLGVWDDYGWDDAFDEQGNWTRGPLHGYVFLIKNEGSDDAPAYASPVKLEAGGAAIDVYGMPSPCFADYDNDGDLDLICGEFMDGLTYFQNVGTRTQPAYATSVRVKHGDKPIAMHVQMITPTPIDWDRDGDVDLVIGDEDGRVALVENTGLIEEGLPRFLPPEYFQVEATDLKFGVLVTPVSVDWDNDGDEDLVCGNTSGNIGFIENLDGGSPPKWAAPQVLRADGEPIHIQAGGNGSIQGPAEAKWGYTTISVADWNHDGLLDIVANSIWGKIVWFENVGTKTQPSLAKAQPVAIQWGEPIPKPEWNWWTPARGEFASQWRTTPVVIDWNRDGLHDIIMLDHEGYLAFFERQQTDEGLVLMPGQRVFHEEGKTEPLRLNAGWAGKSGRRKLTLVDWDGDGLLDLLANSRSVDWHRNLGERNGKTIFAPPVRLGERRLAGHTTSPTTVDWDRDGVRDLLIGAEDGRFYFLKNDHHKNPK